MDTAAVIFLGIFAIVIIIIALVAILRFLKGTIEVKLEKYQFSHGEKINGDIVLKLKKNVKGNKLEVSLIGEMRQQQVKIIGGKRSTKSKTERVFEFNLPIESQQNYITGEKKYNFSITIPKDSNKDSSETGGISGVIINTLKVFSNQNNQVRWFVQAHLDAKGLDLYSKEIQINII